MSTLDKGIFTISIDHEFAWGYVDHDLSSDDKDRIRGEVAIVNRLISLFEEYQIPVTWAVVGHLIDRGCTWGEDGTPHPEYKRPICHSDGNDWFSKHPPMHDYSDVLWYDTANLVSRIRASSANHDIASHSYAHILYDEETTNEECVKADLKNLGRVHRVHDVPLTTFIFPRNVEGYYRLLKVNGFTNYRGTSPRWYDKYSGQKKRIARLLDYYLPNVPTVIPEVARAGLINIPDSMLLLGRNGFRKLVTKSAMKKKAKRGIELAIKKKQVFHLWFHPSNFSYDTETQFEILEDILKNTSQVREKGELEILTMQDIAQRVTH